MRVIPRFYSWVDKLGGATSPEGAQPSGCVEGPEEMNECSEMEVGEKGWMLRPEP